MSALIIARFPFIHNLVLIIDSQFPNSFNEVFRFQVCRSRESFRAHDFGS